MHIQKLKNAFTLIEVMVVIVIVGVLAAIAIPKLFGISAKAKASEVGPAVGTWSKLQQIHAMNNLKVGSFSKIGYIPPSSNNFEYSGTPAGELEGLEASWTAKLLSTLNDCQTGPNATWNASAVIEGGKVNITALLPTDLNCARLTPNFDKLQ